MIPPERDVTRERFLAAIAQQVDADTIAEAHLFHPMKQGGIESGVAVVAVREQREEQVRPEPPREGQLPGGAAVAVYTAKYRLALKGPDRGKWDFAIQVEADAPLVTVDKVVRGVMRRSGDAQEPERLSGAEFRALLPPPTAGAPRDASA